MLLLHCVIDIVSDFKFAMLLLLVCLLVGGTWADSTETPGAVGGPVVEASLDRIQVEF